MKKILYTIIAVSLMLIFVKSIDAYLDCNPSSCPNGYEDYGEYCEGSTCERICVQSVCNESTWDVMWLNSSGWNFYEPNANNVQDQTPAFNSENKNKCYKLEFIAPQSFDNYIEMNVPDHTSCTTEGAAGYKASESHQWFENLTVYSYYGGVGGYDSYKLVPSRGSTDDDADFQYRQDMSEDGVIYCANNTVACEQLPDGINRCATACYDQTTVAHAHQGWLLDVGSHYATLNNNQECGYTEAQINRYTPFYLNVSETDMYLVEDNQTCYRINEAPSAYNITVIPETPNAGQDLECDFDYTDPENFVEQNSAFEWWKNSVNQNINSRTLDKGNLTVGNSWYCKVTPSDGLLLGNKTQSSNTVTILTTVKDPAFKINEQQIWSESGYYGEKQEVLDFNQELNDALSACTPDAQGYCDINLTFSSEATGVIELTNMEIFYTLPAQDTPYILNLNPQNNSVYTRDQYPPEINATILDNNDDVYWTGIYASNEKAPENISLVHQEFNIPTNTFIQHNLTSMPIQPDSNTILLYHFDSISNGTLQDSSYYNKQGTTDADLDLSGGKLAGAIYFNITNNESVDVGDDSDFEFGSNDFSIAAWIKLNSLPSQTTSQMIFTKAYWATNNLEYGFGVHTTGDLLTLVTSPDGTGASEHTIRGSTALQTGKYYHVAVVKPGVNADFYVNGEKEPSTIGVVSSSLYQGNANVKIGVWDDPVGWFDGSIDELVVYNRALSPIEIKNMYRIKEGVYNWNITITDLTGLTNSSETRTININPSPPFFIFNLTNLTSQYDDLIIEFQMLNTNPTQDSFRWGVDFDDSAYINSTIGFNLTSGEDAFIILQHEYSQSGQSKSITVTAANSTTIDIQTLEVAI